MQLPFFYTRPDSPIGNEVTLDEDTSRHVVQVLRMKEGSQVMLTDGKGNIFHAAIREAHKKHCIASIHNSEYLPPLMPKTIIGISLVKNSSRFEWFLEKATEIGITEIVPLICKRTEKEKFRIDRLQGILISAMLQSRQCWLPVLHQPIAFELLFSMEEVVHASQKFIAHCTDEEKSNLTDILDETHTPRVLLIGPEGDFTPEEIGAALHNHFRPVSLGQTRLRTETAGIVGAVLLRGK